MSMFIFASALTVTKLSNIQSPHKAKLVHIIIPLFLHEIGDESLEYQPKTRDQEIPFQIRWKVRITAKVSSDLLMCAVSCRFPPPRHTHIHITINN